MFPYFFTCYLEFQFIESFSDEYEFTSFKIDETEVKGDFGDEIVTISVERRQRGTTLPLLYLVVHEKKARWTIHTNILHTLSPLYINLSILSFCCLGGGPIATKYATDIDKLQEKMRFR